MVFTQIIYLVSIVIKNCCISCRVAHYFARFVIPLPPPTLGRDKIELFPSAISSLCYAKSSVDQQPGGPVLLSWGI